MKKLKRIMALLLALFLFSLYGITLVVSIIGGPNQESMMKACLFSTIFIPILLWTYNLIFRVLKRDSSPKADETADKITPHDDQSE